jgi:hypothetical protein
MCLKNTAYLRFHHFGYIKYVPASDLHLENEQLSSYHMGAKHFVQLHTRSTGCIIWKLDFIVIILLSM